MSQEELLAGKPILIFANKQEIERWGGIVEIVSSKCLHHCTCESGFAPQSSGRQCLLELVVTSATLVVNKCLTSSNKKLLELKQN